MHRDFFIAKLKASPRLYSEVVNTSEDLLGLLKSNFDLKEFCLDLLSNNFEEFIRLIINSEPAYHAFQRFTKVLLYYPELKKPFASYIIIMQKSPEKYGVFLKDYLTSITEANIDLDEKIKIFYDFLKDPKLFDVAITQANFKSVKSQFKNAFPELNYDTVTEARYEIKRRFLKDKQALRFLYARYHKGTLSNCNKNYLSPNGDKLPERPAEIIADYLAPNRSL